MFVFEFDIFLLKKHYCSTCGNIFTKQKLIRTIDRHTEDAYKYTTVDGMSAGDIELNAYHLKCSKCNAMFTIKEQKEIEKAKRR